MKLQQYFLTSQVLQKSLINVALELILILHLKLKKDVFVNSTLKKILSSYAGRPQMKYNMQIILSYIS